VCGNQWGIYRANTIFQSCCVLLSLESQRLIIPLRIIKFWAAHFQGNTEELIGHPIDEESFSIDVTLNVKWREQHRTLLYFCCLGNASSRIMNVCVTVEGSFRVGGSIPYERWSEGGYTCWQILGLKFEWDGVIIRCRSISHRYFLTFEPSIKGIFLQSRPAIQYTKSLIVF
jgi:hypothetical protein